MTNLQGFSALTTLLLVARAHGQGDGTRIYRQASPSVVEIQVLDANGQPTALGSGFAVAPHLIATNFHVIESAKKIRVVTAVGQTEVDVAGIKGTDPKMDLALIETRTALRPLKLEDRPATVGEAVFAIGNPEGLDASFSSGSIAGHRSLAGMELYQITAPISPGSSGGPVIESNGRVVGVARSRIEEGENLNFAVDVKELKDLITRTVNSPDEDVAAVSGPGGTSTGAAQTIQSSPVRVVDPQWAGSGTGKRSAITFDFSMANDGPKTLRNVDLLILVKDKDDKQILDSIRKKVRLSVASGEVKRQRLVVGGLNFDTTGASQWKVEFRVLDYDER